MFHVLYNHTDMHGGDDVSLFFCTYYRLCQLRLKRTVGGFKLKVFFIFYFCKVLSVLQLQDVFWTCRALSARMESNLDLTALFLWL